MIKITSSFFLESENFASHPTLSLQFHFEEETLESEEVSLKEVAWRSSSLFSGVRRNIFIKQTAHAKEWKGLYTYPILETTSWDHHSRLLVTALEREESVQQVSVSSKTCNELDNQVCSFLNQLLFVGLKGDVITQRAWSCGTPKEERGN